MFQNQNKLQNRIRRKTGEKILARVSLTFKNNYLLLVESVIRGHHVYKEARNPYRGEKLMCNHDKRQEAKIFEDHGLCTYKDSRLVGTIFFAF